MTNLEKEQEIQKHMEVLGLTREQAEQLWEEDNSDYVSEEMAEMERKAKVNRRYEQSDKPRAKAKREVKVDEEKVNILAEIENAMIKRHSIIDEDEWDFENVVIANPQREITFRVGKNEYSLTLTKHRPKK